MSLAFDSQTRPARSPAQRKRDFAALDRSRREANIPVDRLLQSAGVSYHTYYDGKAGRFATRQATMDKLWAAIERLRTGAAPPPAAIRALLNAAEELLRARIAKNKRLAAVCLSRSTTPAARIRTLAIYLLTVEIEIDNADVGRAAGCSRQNVAKARDTIEALRDDGSALDRLMTQCATVLRGER